MNDMTAQGGAAAGSISDRGAGKASALVAPSLGLADLLHERLLTLCLVFAIAAVLAPLLLLLGLKHGVVETLRARLIEDPVYRELKPARSQELPASFFEEMSARPDVAFVLPNILRGAALVRIAPTGADKGAPMDVLPTAPADPLLVENGARPPEDGEIALTREAAARLEVAVGDSVDLTVSRRRDGRIETVKETLTVSGVLAARADTAPRGYLPLPFVEDIETYREGLPAPRRGWSGGAARPSQGFDGALVLSARPLSPVTAQRMTLNTGFARLDAPPPAEVARLLALDAAPEGWSTQRLTTLDRAANRAGVRAVRDVLRGQGATVVPYVDELGVRAAAGDDAGGEGAAEVALIGLSPDPDVAALRGGDLPWPAWSAADPAPPYDRIDQILLPQAMLDALGIEAGGAGAAGAAGGGPRVELEIAGAQGPGGDPLRLPLEVVGAAPGAAAIAPLALTAMLRSGRDRPLRYDADTGDLALGQGAYRGFRLYARAIDDAPALHRELTDRGIETIAQTGQIERIQELDRGLTNMFWLVAVVGVGGAVAAMAASLYASVERKKGDLSMLRLLGLSRGDVFMIPLYQAGAIAVMCVAIAFALFFGMSALINRVFGAALQLGERICYLPAWQLAAAFGLTVAVSLLSALYAAWRATRIDPAEAIRIE